MGIKHAFVNPKADGADATITRPSDWNADHVISGIIAAADLDVSPNPTANDLEFKTSTLPPANWTTLGSPTAVANSDVASQLHITSSSNTAGWEGYYLTTFPSTPFTITAKINETRQTDNFQKYGIFIAPSSPGAYEALQVGQAAGVYNPLVEAYTSVNSGGSGIVGASMYAFRPAYLRVVVTNTTSVSYYASNDGLFWTPLATGRNPGFTIGRIGFGVKTESTGNMAEAYFDWIRLGSNVVQPDNTVWQNVGGVQVGSTADMDISPNPTSDDDEFKTSASLPRWTTLGSLDTLNVSDATSCLHIVKNSTGSAFSNHGVYKAIPSMPFTVTMSLADRSNNTNFQFAGFALLDSTPAAIMKFGLLYQNANGHPELYWSVQSNYATNSRTSFVEYGVVAYRIKYLRMVVNSSTSVDLYHSSDGLVWQFVANKNPGFTVSNIGTVLCGEDFAVFDEAYIDWIRFGTNVVRPDSAVWQKIGATSATASLDYDVSPNPTGYDDEFKVAGLSGWTALGTLTTSNSNTDRASHAHLGRTSIGLQIHGLYKNAPTTPFTVTAKFSNIVHNGNYVEYGLALGDSTPTAWWTASLSNYPSPYSVQVESWTNNTTRASSNNYTTYSLAYPQYIRLVVNSTSSVDVQSSYDGFLWRTEVSGVNVGFASKVGIVIDANGVNADCMVDWIRFGTNVVQPDSVPWQKLGAAPLTAPASDVTFIEQTTPVSPVNGSQKLFFDSKDHTLKAVDSGGNLRSFGGGSLVYLDSKIASSSATLDFTSSMSSVYDEYLFEFSGVVPATDNQSLYLQCSTDNGATWDGGAGQYVGQTMVNNSAPVTFNTTQATLATNVSGGGSYSVFGVYGSLRLFVTSRSFFVAQFGYLNITAGGRVSCITQFDYEVGTPNAIRFKFASGNIASGAIRIYGVAKTAVSAGAGTPLNAAAAIQFYSLFK